MKPAFPIFLIAISAFMTSVRAQNHPAPAVPATHATSACPTALEIRQKHLQGAWRAGVAGAAAPGTATSDTTVLRHRGQHPERTGTVQRSATTSPITRAVHGGGLNLEQSTDGTHVATT